MRVHWSSLFLFALAVSVVQAQGIPSQAPSAAAAPDPLAVGKAALQKEDFASALDFFTRYTQENPQSTEALFFLGDAQLGLHQFDAAEKTFRAVLDRDPKIWNAHSNLVLVYAESGQWKKFDDERAVIAAGHQAHAAGLPERTASPIDVFNLNGQRYIVREYYPLQGRFHVKYNFTWFTPEGKLAGWISCESDDVDQVEFAKKHPSEAAAGQRSYSLDSYTPAVQTSDGKVTQTHGTIKFYPDGEPTYEQVRADVMNVLQRKQGPMSSSTVNAAPPQSTSSPK